MLKVNKTYHNLVIFEEWHCGSTRARLPLDVGEGKGLFGCGSARCSSKFAIEPHYEAKEVLDR